MASIILQSAQSAAAWFVARLAIKNERGATAVEYAVMVALIAAVIILAVVFLGRTASSTFSHTGTCVSTSAAVAGC
jgi:pilus assembly protein Flp/PilA